MRRRSFLMSLAALTARRLPAQAAPVHPRLFLDPARVDRLRNAIQNTHAALWKAVKQQADAFAAAGPPKYTGSSDPNDEQLWQREVGNKLPFLAMAHLLTGGSIYLDAAARWSLASCGYPHWGLGREDGTDLAAGHQLFGLACVYDWLYNDLDADARDTIRRTLLQRGDAMYRAATTTGYWRNSFLQNHLWVNITGLAAAGFALSAGEQTDTWISLVIDKYLRTEAALGPDGASHEGVGYWSYGVEYMLKFWHLASDLLGENLSSPWWTNTAAYRLYLGLPRNSWNSQNAIVDVADCPRWDWYGPDYLLRRLAVINQDGHAQWLAAELERAGVTQYAARWLNLLWYDPAIEPQPPSDLPTLGHFEDMGIVAARSDWSGDESLVVFKCGPPIGRAATAQFDYDPGSGHVHPDANHFVVFGAGDWLLRDEGYAWKQTDHHNTLLIDGKGQMGEGNQWFNGQPPIRAKADPRILQADSAPDLDSIAGDATPIYPPDSGLRRFTRRLFFLKPDVLIVVDDIELAEARRLELRFHPQFPCEPREDGTFLARGKKAILRVAPLTPDEVQVTAGDTSARDRDGNPMTLYAVRLEATRAAWKNAVAFSWSAVDNQPATVTLEQDGTVWTFSAGGRSVQLDWSKQA